MTAKEAYERALKAKERLPELEHIIMQSAGHAHYYARDIIEDRWLEAEPVIIQDAEWAYYYARDVIKGRWLEAEEIIAKSDYIEYYTQRFFDEPVITKAQVDIIQWERKKQVGHFAPARLFQDNISLLDMVIE